MQSPPWRTIRNSISLSLPLMPLLPLTKPLTNHHESPFLDLHRNPDLSCLLSDILLSNVATPGWATRSLSTEHIELWHPKHTPPPSSSSFPTPSPLSISPPIVTSSPLTTIEIPPVLSVDVSVHCYCLCSFASPTEHTTLVTTITDLHLTVPFNHYFDDGCPFKALCKAYLQVECLGIIVNSPFTTHNSIAPTVKHIACDVQTWLQAELVSIMY